MRVSGVKQKDFVKEKLLKTEWDKVRLPIKEYFDNVRKEQEEKQNEEDR